MRSAEIEGENSGQKKKDPAAEVESFFFDMMSEWGDLNSRPLDPQSSALPGYATPRIVWKCKGTINERIVQLAFTLVRTGFCRKKSGVFPACSVINLPRVISGHLRFCHFRSSHGQSYAVYRCRFCLNRNYMQKGYALQFF